MIECLNDLRPLARGAHFLLSGLAAALVYWSMSPGTSRGRRMSWAFSAALAAHFCADYFLRVP